MAGEFLTAKKDHNNHGQKSWDTFAFLGRFLFHKGSTPPGPSPHKQSCYRLGEGELQENFEKDARFYEGTHK